MWDNRCVLHYAIKDYSSDDPADLRVVHRTNWYDNVRPSLDYPPAKPVPQYLPYSTSEYELPVLDKEDEEDQRLKVPHDTVNKHEQPPRNQQQAAL